MAVACSSIPVIDLTGAGPQSTSVVGASRADARRARPVVVPATSHHTECAVELSVGGRYFDPLRCRDGRRKTSPPAKHVERSVCFVRRSLN